LLGTWRYILAILVALSHVSWRWGDLNPGVIAVVGFYVTSGYVMTGVLRNRYPMLGAASRFYLDRALRLFPQYLAIALVTLLWFLSSGTTTAFLKYSPDGVALLNNLTVVPLNYAYYNDSDRFALIPPAWSLGAEIQFYLLLPFILRARAVVSVISVTVYVCAAAGIIDSELFGYRLVPGVLWFFLLGSWLYDAHRQTEGKRTNLYVGSLMAAIGLFGLLLAVSGKLALPYNRETLIGVLVALPAVHWLGRLPRHPWDEHLGNLSYGLFLSHFLIFWVVFNSSVEGMAASLGYILCASVCAWLTQRFVERPALKLRQRFRQRLRISPQAGQSGAEK